MTREGERMCWESWNLVLRVAHDIETWLSLIKTWYKNLNGVSLSELMLDLRMQVLYNYIWKSKQWSWSDWLTGVVPRQPQAYNGPIHMNISGEWPRAAAWQLQEGESWTQTNILFRPTFPPWAVLVRSSICLDSQRSTLRLLHPTEAAVHCLDSCFRVAPLGAEMSGLSGVLCLRGALPWSSDQAQWFTKAHSLT